MNDTERALKKVLSRFQKKDYGRIIQNWKVIRGCSLEKLTNEQLRKMSKAEFSRTVVSYAMRRRVQLNSVRRLELLYIQFYSHSKLWHALEITKMSRKQQGIQWNPATLKALLSQELSPYFSELEVNIMSSDDLFWGRVSLGNPSKKKKQVPSSLTYLVIKIEAQAVCMLTTALKAGNKDIFMQAVAETFDSREVTELPLQGKSYKSLLQMVHYKRCKAEGIPWKPRSAKKRKAVVLEEETDPNIICEDLAKKKRRLETLDKVFGTAELPVLEKVDFQLETNFRGLKYAPEMANKPGRFHCKVRFEGSSVIRGIQSLGELGLASVPMKNHMGNLHLLGKSTIRLRMRELNTTEDNMSGNQTVVNLSDTHVNQTTL